MGDNRGRIGDTIIVILFILWLVALGFIAYVVLTGGTSPNADTPPTYNGPVVHVQPLPPASRPSPELLSTNTSGSVTVPAAT